MEVMEMKRKNVIVGSLVVICMLAVLVGISGWLFRPYDADPCICAIEAFHDLPENSVDVIVYGSSHGWRGVNAVEMYDRYGIGAYNYCANWQNLSTEALFVFDSLRTQKPKVALIETYKINNVFTDEDFCGEIYYTKWIPDFDKKKEYTIRAFGNQWERYFAYYFPFSQFHSSWNELKVDNFINMYDKEEFLGTMGYYYHPDDSPEKTMTVDFGNPAEFAQKDLDDITIELLDEVVEECHKNDVCVIFFSTPWQGQNEYHDAMTAYAEQSGCEYIDFFEIADDVGLDGSMDYMDLGHLNDVGAKKVADYIGEYILQRVELQDMRLTPGNMWENKSDNRTGYKWMKYHGK